jgi:hypothetical protein
MISLLLQEVTLPAYEKKHLSGVYLDKLDMDYLKKRMKEEYLEMELLKTDADER